MPANLKTLSAGLVLALTAPLLNAAEVEYLDTGTVLAGGLPFSEVVRVDDTYYLSGQLGVKPGTLDLVPGGIRAEARQAMENIAAVLAANGLDMDDVVKCTVMLADMSEWAAFNEVYRSFFSKHFPARSAFGSTGLGLGARTEVECMAVASDGNNEP